MTGRNIGERLAAIETIVHGTGDGKNSLVAQVQKLTDQVQGLNRLAIWTGAAGLLIGFMLSLVVQWFSTNPHP